MDAEEKKGKGWKEEQMKQTFNAPPVPPFTNYLPIGNFSQPTVSMVRPAAPTTTQSFQPTGPVPAMMQPPAPTTTQSFQPLGTVPSPMYPAANAPMWAGLQTQWTGQGVQVQGPGQSQQEGHQVPYPVGPGYNQFYQ